MNRRDFIDVVFIMGIGCLIQTSYDENVLSNRIVKLPVNEIYDRSWPFIEELINKNGINDLQSKDIELIRTISCWNKQLRSYYGDEYIVLERIPSEEKKNYNYNNYFIYLEVIDITQYWGRHNGRFERWRHKKDWGENI